MYRADNIMIRKIILSVYACLYKTIQKTVNLLKLPICISAILFVVTTVTIAPAGSSENINAKLLKQLPVRGVVRASAQAIVSTDLSLVAKTVRFREGDHVKQGDMLVAFDCRRYKAELASAKAQYREMLVAFESAQYLTKRNAGSRQDVEVARARADRAAADAEIIRARIEQCTVIAPFDGSIAELNIEEYETSVSGKQLMLIVADRNPTIELIIPSKWLTWLKTGAEFRFHVDETGLTYKGIVSRLGAVVDTVSQTMKVFAKFGVPAPNILPGMSGSADFGSHEG